MAGASFTRRGFLGSMISACAASLGFGRLWGAGKPLSQAHLNATGKKTNTPPRVVIAKDPNVFRLNGKIDENVLGTMLDNAMERLTGKSPPDAWSNLFSRQDVVGIKVNCLAGRGLSPHMELIDLIVNRLVACGMRDKNIIVWDRTDKDLKKAGFTIRRRGDGYRCYGTNDDYDTSELEFAGSVGSIFSPILSKKTTATISVPVMKDHDLAGITLSMKNFYGAIHNPNKYHDNNCSPYVADLNSHRFIRNKLRLVITDALTAQYHGGPSFKPGFCWKYAGLIVAQDPVAHDLTGWKIIEEKRSEMGLPSLLESKREPLYIKKAGELGLGESDPALIEVIEV